MPAKNIMKIEGSISGHRVPSKILEEHIQEAVKDGARELLVKADGQHGIGGRIWPRPETVKITVEGPVGQRCGSMGMAGTEIHVNGSASDDVGWINCGAKITVLGDVTNGAHNAAAQGVLYVQGSGGARCDTMTKQNPRFAPPESWYFRNVGDSFAEFKAGGISVVCGVEPRNPENILGYRPCVGMVGGAVYFRGKIQGYSKDVKLVDLSPQDWQWLAENMKTYLHAINREKHLAELTKDINDWKKLIAYTPAEKKTMKKPSMSATAFRNNVWEKEVGRGGIFGEFLTHDLHSLPYVTTGVDRRLKPVWANDKYAPPCAYSCPSRIPSHKRASLIRQGKLKEAIELVLQYSPLPATVCGQVCPNLCMEGCTRGRFDRPLNIKEMGSLALNIPAPKRPRKKSGYTIAVIGGGPAGLSSAWQLALKGHSVDLYEAEKKLGGKIELCIPHERLPHKILVKELSRFEEMGVKLNLGKKINQKMFEKIYKDHDAVIVACGAHEPRKIKFPGYEDVITALDFLKGINYGKSPKLAGKDVVIIGAGNVGMDVASQAFNCGAKSVTAVDVQQPAAFGKELEGAEAKGTKIVWPKVTDMYNKNEKTIYFKDGTSMPADVAIIAVGETPVTDFLPPNIHSERGWIVVDEMRQTSDVKVYAIGDATKPGLVTDAIGQGRIVADVIHAKLMQFDYVAEKWQMIPYERVRTEYYDTCRLDDFKPKEEANLCMSCASCRDCRMCESTCYYGAISRVDKGAGAYEYVVDEDKCIGCGFCAGICPCGVWEMAENN